MEVGGIKTRWLFADALEPGKKYPCEVAGCGEHISSKGKVPYVVALVPTDGVVTEYQISVWKISSKKPFDPEKGGMYTIQKQGSNIYFEKD